MAQHIPSTFRRGPALVIDMLFVSIFTLIVTIPVGSGFSLQANYDTLSGWTFSYYNGIYFVLALIGYFLITGIAFKTSPGKAIMKMKVVSRKSNSEEVTPQQWLLRSLMRPIDFMFGLPLILVTDNRYSCGDLVAQTQVVKKVYSEGDYQAGGWKQLLRKGIGLLTLLVSLLIFGGVMIHLPQILEITPIAQAQWQQVSTAIRTQQYDELYENTSQHIKQSVTLQEFAQIMSSLDENFRNRNIDMEALAYQIRTWNFSQDFVTTQGYAGQSYVEMVFIEVDGGWQLAGFNVIP